MKTLLLCDSFLPHAGGARVYYYNLYRRLVSEYGSEVTVLTKKVPGWRAFDNEEVAPGFRILRCGKPLRTWTYHELPKILIPFLRSLPLLAFRGFDVLHTGDLYPQGAIALAFKRLFGIPFVPFCHGEEITQTDRWRHQPALRNAIYQGADAAIAANEFARQCLLRIGVPAERIHKIPPGVDCERFKPEAPRKDLLARYGLEGKVVLLTVGRVVPRKGHRTVIEAVRALLPEIPNLAYLIVGTGFEEAPLRQVVEDSHMRGIVKFAGEVSEAELASHYNLGHLFVMPNFEEPRTGNIEGFGMVFIEANACGKATIGGRSGGAAEAVLHGSTGLLVDPLNTADLVGALRLLIHNTALRDEFSRNGLIRARREFSWSTSVRLLDQVNQQVLAGSSAAHTHTVKSA